MRASVLLDTGPLVAMLDRGDQFHKWALAQVPTFSSGLLTCEAVISEALFLLRGVNGGTQKVLEMLARGAVVVSFHLDEELAAISKLLLRYANVPMSLADACLVRMAEKFSKGVVFTLDRDFKIYRKGGRQAIPSIMPDES